MSGGGSWLPDELRRVFRIGIAGGDADREVDQELEYHFERTVEDLQRGGMSESDARQEARRRFGDERQYRRELRRLARGRDRWSRLGEAAEAWSRATRDAVRGLARTPAQSLAVVAVLTLGVEANAAVFGILDTVFLRPPAHIQGADRVRRIFVTRTGYNGRTVTEQTHAYPDYMDWQPLDVFSEVAEYTELTLTVGHGDEAERRPAELTSANFFPLLGVRPELGRFYGPEDDRFGAPGTVVLGHAYWQERFAGDSAVLGRYLDIGDATYAIVGVAPPGFTGVDLERIDLWLPMHPAGEVEGGGTEWAESRGWYWFNGVARLAPRVTDVQAEAAATTAHRVGRSDNPNYDPEARVELGSLIAAKSAGASREAKVVPWLMGVALMVLLLACANVANLLLARAIRRRRETAVRLALGVSRKRLIGTALAESGLLALAGGLAAVLLVFWTGNLVRSFLLPGVAWGERVTT